MLSAPMSRDIFKKDRYIARECSADFEKQSDEDTEEASEVGDKSTEEITEMREQMYQDKLAQLRQQLQQLHDKTSPEYSKRLKRLESMSKEKSRQIDWHKVSSKESLSKRYTAEKKSTQSESETKRAELKDMMLVDLEEKKRQLENDHQHPDIGESQDPKSKNTRKLRPRLIEPTSVPEKRRKASPTHVSQLSEADILEDLKIMAKISGKPFRKAPAAVLNGEGANRYDARIEDGKLYYEKRWFHRGQSVYVDSKETGKFGAVISGITHLDGSVVSVKNVADGNRLQILLNQLQKGKFTIKRRST